MAFQANSTVFTTYVQYEEVEDAKLRDLAETDPNAYFEYKGCICYRLEILPKGNPQRRYKAFHIPTGESIPMERQSDKAVYFGRSVTVRRLKGVQVLVHRDNCVGDMVMAYRPDFKKLKCFPLGGKLDWEPKELEKPNLSDDTCRHFGLSDPNVKAKED